MNEELGGMTGGSPSEGGVRKSVHGHLLPNHYSWTPAMSSEGAKIAKI